MENLYGIRTRIQEANGLICSYVIIVHMEDLNHVANVVLKLINIRQNFTMKKNCGLENIYVIIADVRIQQNLEIDI